MTPQLCRGKRNDDRRVDRAGPSLLALELVAGDYRVVRDVRDDGTATLERPFPVTVVPARLVDRSR